MVGASDNGSTMFEVKVAIARLEGPQRRLQQL